MARMTTARAIVRSLVANGVDTVFGLPGVQLDALFNALHDERDRIRVIHPRHEQAAAYMALGYAQASGRVGAYAVVPGPGILNTTAALATAYGACAPVLALTGQLPAHAIGQGYGLLHEIPDQLAILRGLTRWAERIDHPTQAAALMHAAFHELRSGVPRPVAIESPMDVLGLQADIERIEAVPGAPPAAPDGRAIEDAAKLMASAGHPVVVVGGGALHAGDALREVAETLQAPVISHRMGRGILDDRHPLSLTQPAGAMVWKQADAVLAVGTRLTHHRTAWGAAGLATVRIDADPAQMHRLGRPAVPIVADARLGLEALAPVEGGGGAFDRRRRRWSEAQKRQIVAESREPGVSASVVARRYNVNANQVFTWRRQYCEPEGDAEAGRLVPVVVEATPQGEAGAPAPCSSSADVVAPAGRMEIALASGVRVIVDRDVDGRALARVLAVLDRR